LEVDVSREELKEVIVTVINKLTAGTDAPHSACIFNDNCDVVLKYGIPDPCDATTKYGINEEA
jgi:hypothetical protein